VSKFIAGNQRTEPIEKTNLDFYPTPAVATHALMDVEHFHGQIVEPACGDGAMTKVLRKYYPDDVLSFDINARELGYGFEQDFLTWPQRTDNIITNPPYSRGLLMPFVERALEVTNVKVALFMRLVFLESAHRYEFFQRTPPTRIWVFPYRIPFRHKNNPKPVTGVAYAWYIWETMKLGQDATTDLKWIPLESQYAER
jgi:hypothetical protein